MGFSNWLELVHPCRKRLAGVNSTLKKLVLVLVQKSDPEIVRTRKVSWDKLHPIYSVKINRKFLLIVAENGIGPLALQRFLGLASVPQKVQQLKEF